MARIQPGPRRTRMEDSADPPQKKAWEGRLRLWVAIDGHNALGPGKVRLLDAIAATRSLSGAAKELGMSYRLAWKHLRMIEERTGLSVVEPQRGGVHGGGTDLTQEGRALLQAYHAFRRDVEEHMEAVWPRYFQPWLPGSSEGALTNRAPAQPDANLPADSGDAGSGVPPEGEPHP